MSDENYYNLFATQITPSSKEGEGLLFNPQYKDYFPYTKNFIYFTDTHKPEVDKKQYENFLFQKSKRGIRDTYSAFMPFNESTRSVEPFIELLKKDLVPGDIILNLWCRTGYTGEFLASYFPEQTVISAWEGNTDVLGYKGFSFWLKESQRLPNHKFIFFDPSKKFPLKDNSVKLVHGLDTLHRYPFDNIMDESLRVLQQNGSLIFPHIHLTNSEPVPYFDRGERQIHGTQYEKEIQAKLEGTSLKPFILSERDLFLKEMPLHSNPKMNHYNALIFIGDKNKEGQMLRSIKKQKTNYKNGHLILNPMVGSDPQLKSFSFSNKAMGGNAQKMLDRHPIYKEKLRPATLNSIQRGAIFLSQYQDTLKEISQKLGISLNELWDNLKPLEEKDLIKIENIGHSMAKLQHFFNTLIYVKNYSLSQLWHETVQNNSDNIALTWSPDEEYLTYKEADSILRKSCSFLLARGLKKGDSIVCLSHSHPDFYFLFWSCCLLGITFVPLPETIKDKDLDKILFQIDPKLFFSYQKRTIQGDWILYGTEEEGAQNYLSQILECEEIEKVEDIKESQRAVILFTSGSTGEPKGVPLTQGALRRSAETLLEEDDEVYLSLGEFHAMSGLRNPIILPVCGGKNTLLLSPEEKENPFLSMERAKKYRVTTLSTTPSLISYCLKSKREMKKFFNPQKMKRILCTGFSLSVEEKKDFQAFFQIPIVDYYGLTETCGSCIVQEKDRFEKGLLGQSKDSLAMIVNDQGYEKNKGELLIFSNNLTSGYFENPGLTQTKFKKGWFLTGDLAFINKEGDIFLQGRKDRLLINRDGDNIYPESIEENLKKHPDVNEVYVGSLSSLQDIGILISLNKSSPDLEREIFANEELQNFKKRIHFVEKLPKNQNKKIDLTRCHQKLEKLEEIKREQLL